MINGFSVKTNHLHSSDTYSSNLGRAISLTIYEVEPVDILGQKRPGLFSEQPLQIELRSVEWTQSIISGGVE